jgi:hypothetical protein
VRRISGWLLLAVWASAGPIFALSRAASRGSIDCCAPEPVIVVFDAFLAALVSIPIGIVGLWLVSGDDDDAPKAPLIVMAASVFAVPVLTGVVYAILS